MKEILILIFAITITAGMIKLVINSIKNKKKKQVKEILSGKEPKKNKKSLFISTLIAMAFAFLIALGLGDSSYGFASFIVFEPMFLSLALVFNKLNEPTKKEIEIYGKEMNLFGYCEGNRDKEQEETDIEKNDDPKMTHEKAEICAKITMIILGLIFASYYIYYLYSEEKILLSIFTIFIEICILSGQKDSINKISNEINVNDSVNKKMLEWYDKEKFIAGFHEITPEMFFNYYKVQEGDCVGIYIIHNKTKDMYYVGQAKRLFFRVNQHFTGHGNGDVYADYKYGDNFTIQFMKLSESGYDDLDKLEKDMIAHYNAYENGYNKTRGNGD